MGSNGRTGSPIQGPASSGGDVVDASPAADLEPAVDASDPQSPNAGEKGHGVVGGSNRTAEDTLGRAASESAGEQA